MGIQSIKSGTVSAYLKLAGGVTLSASLVSVVDQSNNVSPLQLATGSIGLNAPTFLTIPTWTDTGSKDGFYSQQSVGVTSAGSGVFRMIRNDYTINNTAAQTGSVTGIYQNVTETNLNGITHNLMNLLVGSVSRFLVTNSGAATFSTLLLNNIASFIQFGGSTNTFPMIKRNAAGLNFRLADDSFYCDISAQRILFPSNSGSLAANELKLAGYATITFSTRNYIDGDARGVSFGSSVSMASSNVAANSSAQLDVVSTTKGFLMPRMTQAQILAIASPANGLQVYNTDLAQPCFYDGLGWRKVSHTNM
jgi:hypothetical protein